MKKIWRAIRITLGAVVCLGLILAGGLTWQGWQLYKQAVEARPLEQVLAETRAAENYTTLEELPQFYLDAVVAVEDKRFYKHGGIDLISIARAVAADLQAGALVEGGSTIYTSRRKRNLNAKSPRCLWPGILKKCVIKMKFWNFMLMTFTLALVITTSTTPPGATSANILRI